MLDLLRGGEFLVVAVQCVKDIKSPPLNAFTYLGTGSTNLGHSNVPINIFLYIPNGLSSKKGGNLQKPNMPLDLEKIWSEGNLLSGWIYTRVFRPL